MAGSLELVSVPTNGMGGLLKNTRLLSKNHLDVVDLQGSRWWHTGRRTVGRVEGAES